MNKPIRRYRDAHGQVRIAIFLNFTRHLVPWSKVYPQSITARWRLEDGSIVQIPENAWDCLGIDYEDL